MKVTSFIPVLLLCIAWACSSDPQKDLPQPPAAQPERTILVFYKTAGFYHASIPAGLAAIQELGKGNGFSVDTTNNAGKFTPAALDKYKAVVFLNTTGELLDASQQTSFQNYIRNGGGFVGIHAAADAEYGWPWYNLLLGAYFQDHPHIQVATIQVTDHQHPATAFLPATWVRTDEWYNFRDLSPAISVLATLDETTYTGGKHGVHHPIAWYQQFEGGRSFYTAGGHTIESYSEPLFLQHMLGGIKYAMGE
ncbi:MAG TPA: ThuA domain-containing protein [Adhaeribacter sp.]|nr:ThuA domain-containing protein [Adhaeribacter sp.]